MVQKPPSNPETGDSAESKSRTDQTGASATTRKPITPELLRKLGIKDTTKAGQGFILPMGKASKDKP